jgi:hypothetical protein
VVSAVRARHLRRLIAGVALVAALAAGASDGAHLAGNGNGNGKGDTTTAEATSVKW